MTASACERPVITPVHLGPTWEIWDGWDGVDIATKYILPERTLGWQILRWIEDNLLNEDGEPFKPTREQTRFILWWYAIDEFGVFTYRDGVLQRLKGWGKDPLAAVLAAVEFIGPCRFDRWATEDDDPKFLMARDLEVGDPIAKDHPRAWIQVAAVSKEQTVNTMSIFPGLFSEACMAQHGMNKASIGKEIIYAYNGARRIQAVTSSPKALEGGRPTFVILNETQWWMANNAGHEMMGVIDGNVTKSKGGTARSLSICNAYIPSDDSVAQRQREAWENERDGLSIKTGMLYDSLEAPADTPLAPTQRADGSRPDEEEVRAHIASVIEAVRGDAWWLNIERIVASVLNKTNPPSESRRKYYNQVVAAEDAWVLPAAVDAATDPLAAALRAEVGADPLRAGWIVRPSEPIVVFFDGSKSDDATALVGCRLEDGYTFTLGVWQKPPASSADAKFWRVPRNEVDARVEEVMERFNVVAFWADPSHTKDDDGDRFWDGLIDQWHQRYKDRLQLWATKSGAKIHSIMWDMASPLNTALFAGAAEQFVSEIESVDANGDLAPMFAHDGHPGLRQHMKNARKYPIAGVGISLWKGHRESSKKIDLAVCAVGARMLRRFVQNKGMEEEEVDQPGEIWGV